MFKETACSGSRVLEYEVAEILGAMRRCPHRQLEVVGEHIESKPYSRVCETKPIPQTWNTLSNSSDGLIKHGFNFGGRE